MKNLTYLLFLALNLLASSLLAGHISGKILDQDKQAVFYANVILFSAEDSSIVDLQYSDESGHFLFENIDEGTYWLESRYVGYPDIVSPAFALEANQQLDLGDLVMEEPENTLDEVVVTARKPLIELKSDKVVLNVEGSINAAGSDAFTLLRKSPGVVIDNSDNIFMLGKGGVQIYIDGKVSPLNGSDLVEYLKTIPSSEIESIEIITQPSARYEAEGNAGIINIRLKREKHLGTNGSINMSTAQGITSRYNGTLRLANRTKKFNNFGSISLYDGEGYNPMALYRVQSGSVFDQHALGTGNWKGYNLRLGSDWIISDRHTLGVLYNGSKSTGDWLQDSNTDIFMEGATSIDSVLLAETQSDWDRANQTYNLNYKFDNGAGTHLNIDLDYGRYDNERYEDQPNTYMNPEKTVVLSERDFANESPSLIEIATFKLDYERPLAEGSLSAGLKLSRVLTDNTFNFYNVVDGDRNLDINRSNQFKYDEEVNAFYVSYAKSLGELNLTAGLRAEHTHSVGDLEAMVPTDNERVDRDYLDFFPSIGLSYKLNEKNSFQLNYSRRLNRPSYNDLNPFRERLDELTFEQGNPFLNPEYANSVQLSHSWNYRLTTTLSYSHTSDMIARITDAEAERFAYITWRNIADQYTYSLSMSAPLPVTDWWNSYTSLTGTRTHNKADFGEGKEIDLLVYTFNIYSQHSFKLPGGYSAELSGWYNAPSIWEGNFKMDAIYALDFGIQKTFCDNKLSVRASISDIFKTQKWHGVTTFGNQFIDASGSWDSRRVTVNVGYNFGNKNVKVRKRKTGLEDEKSRVKNENG